MCTNRLPNPSWSMSFGFVKPIDQYWHPYVASRPPISSSASFKQLTNLGRNEDQKPPSNILASNFLGP